MPTNKPTGIAHARASRSRQVKTCGVIKHGAFGIHARKKYSDCRSREGKHLAATMAGIIADLGGKDKLNAGQKLILEGIRSKIIITMQINKYIDNQGVGLVSSGGELTSILQSSYNGYCEGIRRDLESLYLMRRTIKRSDYQKAIASIEFKGKDL